MIREFINTDQPQIINLQEEFMSELFPEFADDPRKYEWNADVYSIQEHYIQKGGKAYVFETASRIVGFGCFRLVNSNTAEIKRVRIHCQHRGRGIGRTIVKKLESYCSTSGISKMLVDTDDRFEAAKSMYLRSGYVLYRTQTDLIDGREYKDNYYEKLLLQA